MSEWSVSKEDVKLLATEIVENWQDYDDYDGEHCAHCSARKQRDGSYPHKPDCLVLVAYDVLTGIEGGGDD